ncbi:uncharacterized protein LOC131843808 [Achroia grisella]|uniref:uncharacterized protein LOC131843808 n=1 Tax=Achroia grisella TaxID=688607 RepID=UPI0027D23617|nr:uncharacterized protein LOC131843808 [Achroia grisella]
MLTEEFKTTRRPQLHDKTTTSTSSHSQSSDIGKSSINPNKDNSVTKSTVNSSVYIAILISLLLIVVILLFYLRRKYKKPNMPALSQQINSTANNHNHIQTNRNNDESHGNQLLYAELDLKRPQNITVNKKEDEVLYAEVNLIQQPKGIQKLK